MRRRLASWPCHRAEAWHGGGLAPGCGRSQYYGTRATSQDSWACRPTACDGARECSSFRGCCFRPWRMLVGCARCQDNEPRVGREFCRASALKDRALTNMDAIAADCHGGGATAAKIRSRPSSSFSSQPMALVALISVRFRAPGSSFPSEIRNAPAVPCLGTPGEPPDLKGVWVYESVSGG